jgi:hypothetical protein
MSEGAVAVWIATLSQATFPCEDKEEVRWGAG